MAIGSYAVYQDSAGSQTAGLTFADFDFATESSDADNILTRTAAGTFRFDEGGCFLIIWNIVHVGASNRTTYFSKCTYDNAGDFVSCYGQGYHRDAGNNVMGCTGWALVRNAAQNDTFSIEWIRGTDNFQTGSRINDSYLTVVRLHDSPTCGLYQNQTDATAFNTGTWTAVAYSGLVVENDTASIERQVGNTSFRLKANALYLIGYCVTFDTATDRTQRITKLRNITDNRDLEWSYGYSYVRNAGNAYGAPNSLCLWKNDGTDTDIQVQAQLGVADSGGTTVRNDTDDDAIFIVELPSSAEGFIGYDQTGGQNLGTTPTLQLNIVNTTEHNDSAAFTRASATAINCEKAMDVLCSGSIFGNRSVANGTRLTRGAQITINGTGQDIGTDINFLRGDQSTQDTNDMSINPWWVGGVSVNDDLGAELVDEGQDGGGTQTTSASRVGMWALNLDSLSAAPSVSIIAQAKAKNRFVFGRVFGRVN